MDAITLDVVAASSDSINTKRQANCSHPLVKSLQSCAWGIGAKWSKLFVCYNRIEIFGACHLIPQRPVFGYRTAPGLWTHPDVPRSCAARRSSPGGAVALSGPPFQGCVNGSHGGSVGKWLRSVGK